MRHRLRQSWQLLSFLVVLTGLAIWWATVALAPQPQEQIRKAVQEESLQVQDFLNRIAQELQENKDKPFSALPLNRSYPYYIYEQEQAIYWSDYHLLPSFSSLRSIQPVQYLNLPEGQFLAFKKEIAGARVIYVLLPLQSSMLETYGSERHNGTIFSSSAFSISGAKTAGYEPVFVDDEKIPLFYINIAPTYPKGNEVLLKIAAWLVILGSLGIALLMWQRAARYSIGDSRFWIFTTAFVVVRILMFLFDLPHKIYPLGMFNPQYYASSSLNPSLADYLLNVVFLLGLLLLLWPFRLSSLYLIEQRLGKNITRIGAVIGVILALLLHYYLMRLLFFHAQFSLDITQNISITLLKLMAWLVVALISIAFFLLTHPLLSWLRNRPFTRRMLVAIALLLLISIAVLAWISWYSLFLLPAVIFYFLLYRQLQPRTPSPKLNYSLFIYLFGAAIVCALSASLALHIQRKTTLLTGKERFATQILTERDLVGEYLLFEATEQIQKDTYIINRFLSPLFSKEGIEQKIRRQYLSRYFDKYETNIRLFGLDGSPLNNRMSGSYFLLQEQASAKGEPTGLQGLFRLPGVGAGDYRYISFVTISYQGIAIGYVMIDLKLKRYQPRTVYPELFLGQQASEPFFERNNYAVYVNNSLRFDAGDFDYLHLISKEMLAQEQLYREGIYVADYHHYGMKGEGDRTVIVSSPAQPFSGFYANFSFLLLLLLFFITLYVVGYLAFNRLSVRYLNFTTKIQLYLNFAIFLPLLIITGSTLSLVSQSSRKETEQQFFDTAESISRGISGLLLEYRQGAFDKESLSSRLDEISRYTETDIHLFDTRGLLLATSQPVIYQKNYLAPVINPRAQAEIVEQHHRRTILTETVGRLQYRSAYVAVRGSTSGNLLGIVSIPFFDSGYTLQRQLSVIFSNIVSIFATLFLVFLFLLYIFSKELTAPLRYIADRLRLISLTGKNEPLSWPTEDEIGMLVREYNLMLLNLQASKEALSRSEKESAWREMAKQVAHEIKNPLTPMRLSLQHLNRRLQDSLDPSQQEKVNKSFQSILDQIDTLSDIATSFSAFAKMPALRQERFDVAAVLNRVVRLYTHEQHYVLDVKIPEGSWLVQGDEQLMQRTFNNLILNGIQAVPADKQPRVQISLQALDSRKVLIKIADNGSGIPETIRTKVFVPNFSTKSSGSGLGLAIAKRGIEHAGGRIWFESLDNNIHTGRIEEGTVFFIELPLVE